MARRGQSAAHERVLLGIAITVTLVWAVATLAQVLDPDHQVPTYANLVMMTVAGSFFGGAVWAGRRNGNGKKDEPSGSVYDEAMKRARKK